MASEQKARLWAFIFYPESCPPDWSNIVDGWHVPVVVSPLHDSDVDQNGELKKEHYHGLFEFDGPVTYSSVLELVSQLGCSHVEKVVSRMSYERYLCHLDSPDKYTYDVAEIKCFGGAVPKFVIEDGYRDGVLAITKLIEELGMVRYSDLSYTITTKYPELLDCLMRYTVHFNNYLRDRLDMSRYNADNLSYVKSRRFGFIDGWEN